MYERLAAKNEKNIFANGMLFRFRDRIVTHDLPRFDAVVAVLVDSANCI
jgi:hypothetical protein